MNDSELKAVIRCVHRLFYTDDILENPKVFLEFHRHLQELFNYAGITSTLVKNNPGEMSPEQVEHAIKQGWIR